MNHQPFETWLLSDEPLSPENTSALDEHLKTCQHCQQLQDGWLGVVNLFDDAPDVEPAPGFVTRWQAHLEADRQVGLVARYRWQPWIMLILIANVIAGLVFWLGTQLFTTFESPTQFVLFWIYRLVSTLTFVTTAQNILVTLLRTLTSVVPAGVWIALAAGLGASSVVWVISMASLAAIPRRT